MAVKVKEIDRGWDRIKREMALAQSAHVAVGILGGSGKHQDGEADLVTVAAVNEFGSPKRHIPERSFIRSTADEQREHMFTMSAREFDKIKTGSSTVRQSLDTMGQKMQDKIVEKINTLRSPPNALSTQKQKGAKVGKGVLIDNPLVDTGQLKQSIRHKIEMT